MTVHQEPYLRSLGKLKARNLPRNRCFAILWRHCVREAAEGLGGTRILVATRAVCAKARGLVCGACSTIRDVYEPKRVSIAWCQTACLESRADASRSRTHEPIASYRLLSRTNWLLLAACLHISERMLCPRTQARLVAWKFRTGERTGRRLAMILVSLARAGGV